MKSSIPYQILAYIVSAIDTLNILVMLIPEVCSLAVNLGLFVIHSFLPSFLLHRPIGIGVQGLADAFLLMRMPFDSDAAQELNKQIFETIYYGAMKASCDIAKKDGAYSTYEGSPVSKGVSENICGISVAF